MNENIPNKSEQEIKEQELKNYIALAKELSERVEGFPFPGIKPESYLNMKATDEEFPGYSTAIDIMIENYKTQGMKVVLGNSPESGNVYFLPLNSESIEEDGLLIHYFVVTEDMDEDLKKLILASGKK